MVAPRSAAEPLSAATTSRLRPNPGPGERRAVRPPVAGAERGGFGDGAAEQPAGQRPAGQHADVARGGVRQQAGLDAVRDRVTFSWLTPRITVCIPFSMPVGLPYTWAASRPAW